jgi:hypothetical protein
MTNEQKSIEARYVVMAALILAAIGIVLYFLPSDSAHAEAMLNRLKIATGFTVLALVFLFGFAILICIANGSMDLSGLLSEVGGKGASMSRFQLLIFTLVIALSLFLLVVSQNKFPAVPPEVLTLLGISASTYAVSKGIQLSAPTGSDASTSGAKEDAKAAGSST